MCATTPLVAVAYQADMLPHPVPVILEIDECSLLRIGVRNSGREESDHNVHTNAVERVRVHRDNSVKGVVRENLPLERLVLFGLTHHGRLRHDRGETTLAVEQTQSPLDKRELGEMASLLRLRLRVGRVDERLGETVALGPSFLSR